ncbi:hypothetical protein NPX13_g932 [Xylaria arbuscula]|uniref:Amino acid permease/ SLC12A domain-containing protein n=1 Tax=Xylaria arbuscula TaxID=114810 RepID=A0A9W8TRQ2_9PEZI|nr:hypothetical protein NPX13_g932 [Xylaria arbuscula]
MGNLKFWGRSTVSEAGATFTDTDRTSDLDVVHDGELTYTVVKANNGSGVTYQEAVGAPVESNSPLGYHVGWVTVIFLNVNQMIGTGIFSTPGTILGSTGSVGLALIYWTIGIFLAFAGFSVYLELASYFPNRSGGEVVYLEQAYPRPRHFFPIAFAFYSVVLSFSSSNAIGPDNVDAIKKGHNLTLWPTGVIINNKYSLWATNGNISITGFVVLGGHVSRVSDPGLNFRNSFEGTTNNGNDLSVALVNVLFAYNGYSNAFNLANEIKNPIPTLRRNGAISIAIVALLYIFCNIAYFAAVPKETFAQSKAIAASVFFGAVFGEGRAQDALNALVLISAFGNLLVVLIGQSRLIREIGRFVMSNFPCFQYGIMEADWRSPNKRQGVLPFTEFWVSTKPFGTPIGPYLLKWVVTIIFIIAPPAGDAFQFVISLKTYPDGIFFTAMAIGLYIIRHRQKRLNRERPAFKAWDVAVIFFLLVQVYTLATPWIPPKNGPYSGAVSFWYATYAAVGIGMHLLPKWRGYRLRPEILNVDSKGANTHRLIKVPVSELEEWDREHDEAGRLRRGREFEGINADDGSVEKDRQDTKV